MNTGRRSLLTLLLFLIQAEFLRIIVSDTLQNKSAAFDCDFFRP